MNIQWYPGHMTKAFRQMQEDMKLIDLVIELLDARLPLGSRNPDIEKLTQGKGRILILNKADMAEKVENERWVRYYKEQGLRALLLDSRNSKSMGEVRKAIEEACRAKRERDQRRGLKNPRPVRALVAGIPNVGKSTFINSYAKKAATKTGNRPGVTKGKQWIRLGEGVELLDTPGVLWPKFEDPQVGLHLAMTGSINDEILEKQELAAAILELLRKDHPAELTQRYEAEAGSLTLEDVGRRRGCLKKGGEVDLDKAAACVIDDLRSNAFGRITLEHAPEVTED